MVIDINLSYRLNRIDQEDRKHRNRERKLWRKEKRMRRSLNPLPEDTDDTQTKDIVHDVTYCGYGMERSELVNTPDELMSLDPYEY